MDFGKENEVITAVNKAYELDSWVLLTAVMMCGGHSPHFQKEKL